VAPDLVIVDADTLAGWRRATPSLDQLWAAVDDLRELAPDATLAIVADPSLKWALDDEQRERIDDDVAAGRIVSAPAGAKGGHRGFVEKIVERAAGQGRTTVVVTDQAIAGATLSRIGREGRRFTFDLDGYRSDVTAAEGRGRRRRSRSAA
jgi:hypothetical protein